MQYKIIPILLSFFPVSET